MLYWSFLGQAERHEGFVRILPRIEKLVSDKLGLGYMKYFIHIHIYGFKITTNVENFNWAVIL